MSPVRPNTSARRQGAGRKALLLASALATLCVCTPAWAQAVDGLRGEVTEQQINNSRYESLLPKRIGDTTARKPNAPGSATNSAAGPVPAEAPPYQPDSLGGLTQPEEDRLRANTLPSIFDDDAGNTTGAAADPFAGSPPIPSSRGRRETATDRANQTNERAMSAAERSRNGPKTAAERNRAPGDDPSDTDDLLTGATRTATVDSLEEAERALELGSEREKPIEGILRTPEENPYEAPGIRVGSFILRSSLEQGITATSNGNNSADGSDAVLSETTLRLNAISDWSENKATIDAYGNFEKSISGEDVSEPEIRIDAELEYQLANEYRLITGFGYRLEQETASSPDFIEGVSSQPYQHTLDGSLGVSKDLGKLRLGVTGTVEREFYGDAEDENGNTLPQDFRNSTLASVAFRTGYEVTPSLRPFVELETGHRFFDEDVESGDSNRLGVRAGIEMDRGEKLTGEFSAGWLREAFESDNSDSISGASLNANMRWSPQRETTIGLLATTTVDTPTAVVDDGEHDEELDVETAGDSGSLLYSARLIAEREIRADLTASAMLGLDWRDYTGSSDHDLTLYAEASTTWWMNRYLGLTARVRHENLRSTLDGRDYESNSIFGGVKVQR